MIEDLLNSQQGHNDYIEFTPLSYDSKMKSLQVRIDYIGDGRWNAHTHFENGEIYEFKRHHNSNEEPFDNIDPMELWEAMRPNQKDDELILPQILLYFWHNDNRLSMELDW